MLQSTVKYNTEICLWLASHVPCSVDHFDKLIFIFQLPNQAEKFKCNTLLTRLLHLKNSFFLPQFPWLILCVCVYMCHCRCEVLPEFTLSALCHSSLCSRVSENSERAPTSVFYAHCLKSDGGTWACT